MATGYPEEEAFHRGFKSAWDIFERSVLKGVPKPPDGQRYAFTAEEVDGEYVVKLAILDEEKETIVEGSFLWETDYCDLGEEEVDFGKREPYCDTHDLPMSHTGPDGDTSVCDIYAKTVGCNCCVAPFETSEEEFGG